MRRWSNLVLITLVVSACDVNADGPRPDSNAGDLVRVLRVLDGDSFIGGVTDREIEIRLAGINAPEGDECLGDAARDRLANLITNDARLVSAGSDQFGRTLGIVSTSHGSTANRQMVTDGLAFALSGSVAEELNLYDAQESAADAGIGIWASDACGATSPRPDVVIQMTSPDPPGPDDDRLDQERVTLHNRGDEPLVLAGWVLRDESTANRLRFPDGLVLAPNESLDIVSGCDAGPDSVAWCSDRAVWNNGGDSAILLDTFGRVVAFERFLGR